MDFLQKKMSKGRNRSRSQSEASDAQLRVEATAVGAQSRTKSFAERLKMFQGTADITATRPKSFGDKSWRGSGSFSTVSSRSSASLSECFANDGPIQQSAASLESPSRARQASDVELPDTTELGRSSPFLAAMSPWHASQAGEKHRENDTPRSQADTASQADTDPGPLRRFTAFDSACCSVEAVDPSQPASSASDDPEPSKQLSEVEFCTGIKWVVRNNKLVVAAFSKWSIADKIGVRHGDILRSIDGVDVLNMTRDDDEDEDEEGHHPAMDLLVGSYGTACELSLMRVDPDQIKMMMQMAKDGQPSFSKEKLQLRNVTYSVPRLIRSDIGTPL